MVTGAIAIGMVATSTSTTITISIRTTILTATSIAKAATGNTIRNIAETHPMGTGKQRTSLAARVRAELVIDPVVPVALVVLVVQVAFAVRAASAELVVQVAPAGLELGQVVAVPERDPVAVLVRTRSVIAAHHRDQVPVPRVEDLRAAAETMHAPAAAEAEKAWAAAG